MSSLSLHVLFFFNDTATTEIYTLSLHDALPIWPPGVRHEQALPEARFPERADQRLGLGRDRKSTRLNSSHGYISYAVFCLKKKKKQPEQPNPAAGGLGTLEYHAYAAPYRRGPVT